VETDSTGPAFEFNWGAIPRVQLHAILPWGSINPSNNPLYLPGGTGPSAFGLTDMDLAQRSPTSKNRSTFPRSALLRCLKSLPAAMTGDSAWEGLVQTSLWFQKNIGHWLLDSGAGETIVPQTQYRNFPYGGFLLKYTFVSGLS